MNFAQQLMAANAQPTPAPCVRRYRTGPEAGRAGGEATRRKCFERVEAAFKRRPVMDSHTLQRELGVASANNANRILRKLLDAGLIELDHEEPTRTKPRAYWRWKQ